MPHAPLLLGEVAGEANAPVTAPLAAAVRSIDLGTPDVVVVASPHGRATGPYGSAAGDLGAFGVLGIEAPADARPEAGRALVDAWGRPVLEHGADHGVVVPLRLLETRGAPVIAVAFEEGVAAEHAAGEGVSLARALLDLDPAGTVAFVASANLSAGLGERSPLPRLEAAPDVDAAVLDALREDPAALVDLAGALDRAGSCAAAPLAAFGVLFAGRQCDVLAYEHPFGVGYPVAVVR